MASRTRLLAYIYIVICGGCIAVGVVLCLGLLFSQDPRSSRALEVIGGGFLALSAVYFIPGLLGGLGLLRAKPWARVVIIVLSILVLLAFPIGTALGGFGLWVLLGRDWKQVSASQPQASIAPKTFPVLSARFDPARHGGLLIAMAAVGAAFVVMIGTGYRVTHTPGSPVSDATYFAAIGVLVLIAGIAVGTGWFRTALGPNVNRGARWSGGDRKRHAEERRRMEEEHRRRLERLAADPVRQKYVERIQRGEAWSDEQIEYDLNRDSVATCLHLQPVERAMRAAGIPTYLEHGMRVSAECCVDPDELQAQFELPAFVRYSEPTALGRGFEDPPDAHIVCGECNSAIDVVHQLEATPETPWFPLSSDPVVLAARSAPRTDEISQLRERVRDLARIIDAPGHLLPSLLRSDGDGRPHIEFDGSTYFYVVAERGQEYERTPIAALDELLYRAFRDTTFSMAAAHEPSRPGQDARRGIFRYQLELLERIDPAWATRCAAEHEVVLTQHPFVDGRR